jgi:hypothetical protein
MAHAIDLLFCRQPTECSLQGVIDNHHIVALLFRCSRHSPIVLQYDWIVIMGRPVHLLLIRDHINVDWHTQEHQRPLFVVLGPLANIICNLQEDGVSLLFWRDHQQAALVGAQRKVSAVDCHTDGLLQGMMPSLNIQSPNSFALWREKGMPGVGLLKRYSQKKLNPDMYVPRLAKAVTR